MPNITRGDRAGGLLVYLAGPGRFNEHEEPHLVAGDSAIMAWHGDDELNAAAAAQVARDLEHPRRAYGVEVPGGHVWHCSLSLAASEGQLSDETWGAIAQEFVDELGFTETSGKAACRWVAVRHGVSSAGNDHIHIAVSLVREDGTKASVFNDYRSAQRVAGQLEQRHGLVVLESRQHGHGLRGVTPAEQAKTARATTAAGRAEPERVTLDRRVRGYAAASADEAEFVRRCRHGGLLIRPRFAANRSDVVVGYSAALRATPNDVPGAHAGSPVWFGGGRLGRDLTLPRLRTQWPDTPEHASAAVAEWNAARRGQAPTTRGREAAEVDPSVWKKCHADLATLQEQLRSVGVDDVATWAQVAHDTSGVLAAWSTRTEATPGPLAEASREMSRFAQIQAHRVPVKRVPQPGMRDAAMLLVQGVAGSRGGVSQALLLRQMMATMKALHDYQLPSGQAQGAAQVEAVVRSKLMAVHEALPAPTKPRTGAVTAGAPDVDEAAIKARDRAFGGQAPMRQPGPPLPGKLTPGQGKPATTSPAPSSAPYLPQRNDPGQGPGRRR